MSTARVVTLALLAVLALTLPQYTQAQAQIQTTTPPAVGLGVGDGTTTTTATTPDATVVTYGPQAVPVAPGAASSTCTATWSQDFSTAQCLSYKDRSTPINCGNGIKVKQPACVAQVTGLPVDTSICTQCAGSPPPAYQVCSLPACTSATETYSWAGQLTFPISLATLTATFGACDSPCGGGWRYRKNPAEVYCQVQIQDAFYPAAPSLCAGQTKPLMQVPCSPDGTTPNIYINGVQVQVGTAQPGCLDASAFVRKYPDFTDPSVTCTAQPNGQKRQVRPVTCYNTYLQREADQTFCAALPAVTSIGPAC